MNSLKRIWPWFRDLGLILIGSLAQAVGLRLFLVPAQLLRVASAAFHS